ncbi:AMP-binding enzyme [Actinomadura chokoriensis]|uniref:AMP-binding enzyme n=1 Tax=Actinomadura chokoriensis TaxID=454156 RepID=UPI0031F93852
MNWRLTPAEIAAVVADAGAPVTVLDAGFASLAGGLPGTVVPTGGEHERWLAAHPADDPGYAGEPDDIVVQLYTSGTTGVPKRWGETVKGVVVRGPEAGLTEGEVLDYARERLAGFKRPRSVDFVDVLPRNPSGKILKKDLRAPYWEGLGRTIA